MYLTQASSYVTNLSESNTLAFYGVVIAAAYVLARVLPAAFRFYAPLAVAGYSYVLLPGGLHNKHTATVALVMILYMAYTKFQGEHMMNIVAGPGYDHNGSPCVTGACSTGGCVADCKDMNLMQSREQGALPTYEFSEPENRPIPYALTAVASNLPEPLSSLPDENIASLANEWPASPPVYADYAMYDHPDRLDVMTPIPVDAGRPMLPEVGAARVQDDESLLDKLSNLIA